jgi:hypothetical protein
MAVTQLLGQPSPVSAAVTGECCWLSLAVTQSLGQSSPVSAAVTGECCCPWSIIWLLDCVLFSF